MEWTREKTLALISEYRRRRELWDMTHDDYRKKEVKQRFLLEVSKNLGGISISEIEKKFHTLRTQYHREINRMNRKESYKSKWFGFKHLQFLSSPKACRSSKGRIKSEITEDGTVTTKYIISDHPPDNSTVSINSSNSTIPDEFLTIHRKPSNISYETENESAGQQQQQQQTRSATSRSQALEKLIEETTKDVEYIDSKPKLTVKEVDGSMDTQAYETSGGGGDVENDPLAAEQMQHDHESDEHNQEQHSMSTADNDNLAIEIQSTDGEIIATNHYHQAGSGAAATTTTIHNLPRIIKIQRRDTIAGQEDDYYHHHHHQSHQQQQDTHVISHALPQATKRIFYGANGQHTATILTPTTPPTQANPNQHRNNSPTSTSTQQQQQQQQTTVRDEYSTYGEYVANEMRNLTNREVLIALKHKINNALFEANMAELQK